MVFINGEPRGKNKRNPWFVLALFLQNVQHKKRRTPKLSELAFQNRL